MLDTQFPTETARGLRTETRCQSGCRAIRHPGSPDHVRRSATWVGPFSNPNLSSRSEPRTIANRASHESAPGVGDHFGSDLRFGSSRAPVQAPLRFRPRFGSGPASVQTPLRFRPRFGSDPASVQTLFRFRPCFGSGTASVQTPLRFRHRFGSSPASVQAVSWVERCLGEAACRSSDGAGLPGRRANSSALGSAQVNLGLRLVRATTMGGGRARRTAAMPSVCSLTGPHGRLTRRATRGRWGIAVFVEGPRNTPCEVASAVIRAPNAPARWAQAVLPGSSGSSWRGSSAGSARGDADAACTAGAILLAGPSQLSFLGCAPLQSGCSGLEVGALVDAASGTRYCIWPFSAQRPPRRLAG
jgi:hypothetical protein